MTKEEQLRALREAKARDRNRNRKRTVMEPGARGRVVATVDAGGRARVVAPVAEAGGGGGNRGPAAPVQPDEGGGLDRITFSAPKEEGWPARLERARREKGLRSTSEVIRAALEKGLPR